jgi:hypothetical protein
MPWVDLENDLDDPGVHEYGHDQGRDDLSGYIIKGSTTNERMSARKKCCSECDKTIKACHHVPIQVTYHACDHDHGCDHAVMDYSTFCNGNKKNVRYRCEQSNSNDGRKNATILTRSLIGRK